MMLGMDIGGVSTKVSIFHPSGRLAAHFRLPFAIAQEWSRWVTWFDRWMASCPFLRGQTLTAVVVSVTAELSDAFTSKADGVDQMTRALEALFGTAVRMVTHQGMLVTMAQARHRVWDVAAANWMPTARWIGRHVADAIMIDIGSTTTDIIPIVGGRPDPEGRSDVERLQTGELVYLGIERTPVNSLAAQVPFRGKSVPVAGELFAQSGDAWRVAGYAGMDTMHHVPVDGRTWSRTDCRRRLAKIICADLTQMRPEEIKHLATYLVSRQMARTYDALTRLARTRFASPVPVYVVGQGAKCLARYGQVHHGPRLAVWTPVSECWSSDALGQFLPLGEEVRA